MRCNINGLVLGICLFSSAKVLAGGMVPETSLLLVNAGAQGASMDVTNTDEQAQLLYTQIVNLPDDTRGPELIVTQPVVRVEAGKTQRVRFVLKQSPKEIRVEHFKRVVFSAIPQREENKVKMLFSQDLPVIIAPADLPPVADPWKNLRWTLKAGKAVVENDTPYVVRLEQKVKLLPSGNIQDLGKSYILPGQTLTATPLKALAMGNNTQIEIYPATRYGYSVDKYRANLH